MSIQALLVLMFIFLGVMIKIGFFLSINLFYEALQKKDKKILELIKRKYSFFQKLLEDTLGLDKDIVAVTLRAPARDAPTKNGNHIPVK